MLLCIILLIIVLYKIDNIEERLDNLLNNKHKEMTKENNKELKF